MKKVLNAAKVAVLVAVWISLTAMLMAKDEKLLAFQPLSVPANDHKSNFQMNPLNVYGYLLNSVQLISSS